MQQGNAKPAVSTTQALQAWLKLQLRSKQRLSARGENVSLCELFQPLCTACL